MTILKLLICINENTKWTTKTSWYELAVVDELVADPPPRAWAGTEEDNCCSRSSFSLGKVQGAICNGLKA